MVRKTTTDKLQCLPKPRYDISCKSLFSTFMGCIFNFFLSCMSVPSEKCSTATVIVEEKQCGVSFLDLPETTLECILECLSLPELCKVSTVCTFLRDKCRSHHLWDKHMEQKWSQVVGDVAYQEWKKHKALSNRVNLLVNGSDGSESLGSSHGDWPMLPNSWEWSSSLLDDCIMAWCISLESGRSWFPAQVFAGKGDGLMLYWYDAYLKYDYRTDTFFARYPHDSWHNTVTNISWDMVRLPVVDVSPYALHNSDCLDDLRPGDLIETQWRSHDEDPYDWWYGVVGHLEHCDKHWMHCRCQCDDMLILEFNQFSPDSHWRRAVLNRKDHNEQGNEDDGFYGGIRKIQNEEEIAWWKEISRT